MPAEPDNQHLPASVRPKRKVWLDYANTALTRWRIH